MNTRKMIYPPYLNVNDFKELQKDITELTRSKIIMRKFTYEIIAKPIKKKDSAILTLNEDVIYELKEGMQDSDYIANYLNTYLSYSYDSLSDTDRSQLNTKDVLNKINNASIKNLKPQILSLLLEKGQYITLDSHHHHIHFTNGYINLRTSKFYTRKAGKHFITQCINYDYTPSEKKTRKSVKTMFSKIFTKTEDLTHWFKLAGVALCGESSSKLQKAFILYGTGSAGKSVSFKLLQQTFQSYFLELSGDSLEMNHKNKDKILNTFRDNDYRYAWINEVSQKPIDDALFKGLVDGSSQATQLFKDGQTTIKLSCMFFFTANYIPKIKWDSGTIRRIDVYEMQSEFVDDDKDVDETKLRFKKDNTILSKFNNAKRNALIDLLLPHAKAFYDGTETLTDRPESFIVSKQEALTTNDTFQEFIDSYLQITDEDGDRVGKGTMFDLFRQHYPMLKYGDHSILSSLKDKGLQYSCTKRVSGLKGAFIGVTLKSIEEEDDDDDGYLFDDESNKDKFQAELAEKDEVIDDLRKRITELELQISKKQDYVVKTKKKPKQTKETVDVETMLSDLLA